MLPTHVPRQHWVASLINTSGGHTYHAFLTPAPRRTCEGIGVTGAFFPPVRENKAPRVFSKVSRPSDAQQTDFTHSGAVG